jgi:RNA polymerase sigma factor (sigma-70 family)
MNEPSVELLDRYRRGDEQAATEIFRRYVGRLTVLARARLSPKIARRIDAEDVVVSAYRSFFVRARNGHFTLDQSGSLWRLLVGIVLKKLYHQAAQHTAGKRSVNCEISLPDGGDSTWGLLQLANASTAAEQAVELADLLETFMRRIPVRSRRVVELRLQDLRITDIAAELKVNEKTVRRILDDLETRLRDALWGNGEIPATSAVVGGDDEAPTFLDKPRAGNSAPQTVNAPSLLDPQGAVPEPDSDLLSMLAGADLPVLSDRDFVIELHLGSGGSSKVYRARRKIDNRPVAFKVLQKANHKDPAAVARFFEEARTVARLRHPGIVAVIGFGRTRGGSCFLVQQLVDGRNLAEVAAKRRIELPEALAWVAAAADALDYAHRQNVVHCDLKPANLLVDVDGIVRVTDFGLAQILTRMAGNRQAIAGTFGFMAPEQIDSSWGQIEPATDVFGLGAVLFALLAGRAPFAGHSVDALLHDLLTGSPAATLLRERPDLPRDLEMFVASCLAPVPRDRPSSAAELAARSRTIGVRCP